MTLRHTPTAVLWSIFVVLPAAFGAVDVVVGTVAVVTGSLGSVTRVARGLVYLAPMIVLWRTRVRLQPGQTVVVVNGLRTHRLGPGEVVDVRMRSWGPSNWRTLIDVRDGEVVQAWGLTATKLLPGLAGDPEPRSRPQALEVVRRPPPASLVRRVDELRAHVGSDRP